LYTVPNDLMKKTILDFNTVPVNEYSNIVNQSSSFISESAKSLGIEVKSTKSKKMKHFYYNKHMIGMMNGLKPSTTGKVAFQLCRNKFRLENFLNQMGIVTLHSQLFYDHQKEDAHNFIKSRTEEKFVLKPLNLAGGTGIELNVDDNNFSESWDSSIQVQMKHKIDKPSCIVQPFIQGFDVRVSIIEGRFSAAILRLPAHVVGNGRDSIKTLIENKNADRLKIKYFNNKSIKINKKLIARLSKCNYDLNSVLPINEIFILTDISNLTLGGESIDITDIISDEIKQIALKATATIPGLYTAGIDFMTDNYLGNEAYIIEMNTNANHTIHHVPLKGKVRHPFNMLIHSLLVKYKIEKGIMLNQEETLIMKDIYHFNSLKNKYSSVLYNNSNL